MLLSKILMPKILILKILMSIILMLLSIQEYICNFFKSLKKKMINRDLSKN